MLPRIFLDGQGFAGEVLSIGDDDGHHFARVLRVEVQEPVVVAMDNGPWLGRICAVGNHSIDVILESTYRSAEPLSSITVVQGVAKGDKMDVIMQKCTEIGASGFTVYQAKRSVARLDGKVAGKLARWRKVVREAAMQGQRDVIPPIDFAADGPALVGLLQSHGINHAIVLDEVADSTSLQSALSNVGTPHTKRALLVGPEGGWSDEDRTCFKGFEVVSFVTLGPRILRTETAGATALAIALAHFGDMGG